MKRLLTGASRAGGPDGLTSMWQWLIAGILTIGMAPISAQAQDLEGSKGYGRTGQAQSGTNQTSSIAAATLFGLPAKNGRVEWPLGLRILAPAEETKALREQLEVVLYFVATQAAEGQVNRAFIDFGLQAVRDLRQRLKPRQGAMAAFTYTEASRFLDRAEGGLAKIKKLETSSGGAYP
jgi:hypothetical protein